MDTFRRADTDMFTIVPSANRTVQLALESHNAAATVQFHGVDYVLSEGVPQVIEFSDLPQRSLPLVITAAAPTEVSWQFVESASVEIGDNQVALIDQPYHIQMGVFFRPLPVLRLV
ncbi:MAG: hypothetical protein R3C28_19455 [Pirellulaceae bacterium]